MNQRQRSVVHGAGLFAGIEPEQIDGMLGCLNARQEHYEKNTVVWNMGDTVHACALVLSGSLRAESVNAAGEHLLMATHRPGALVGDVLMATPGSKSPVPKDAVSRVSCKKRWYSRTADARYNVVAIDCGMKLNIVRSLNECGCNVTIVPYNTSVEDILYMKPDGIFLSNGPGDPQDVGEVIETVRALKGKIPIFGICLGHQILSLAYGGSTYKLKFGHRGGNHPVKNLVTGKIEITSQNHSYAVVPESLEGTPLEVTHINLLDKTIEGVVCPQDRAFSVQYHPESAPGPQDSRYLFRQFVAYMEEGKGNAETY